MSSGVVSSGVVSAGNLKQFKELLTEFFDERYGGGKTIWECGYCHSCWAKPYSNCPNCNAPHSLK